MSEIATMSKRGLEKSKTSTLNKLLQHKELFFSLLGGVFLFCGIATSQSFNVVPVAFFILSYAIGGFYKAKEGMIEIIYDKSLNVELLMILAALGAALIGYWSEGAILIFIFSLSGALETYTLTKSHKEISSLMKLQPEVALVINDHTEKLVPVTELDIDDLVLIKPGERVPTDGLITKGQTTINESAITGESLPVTKSERDEVFAGTVNLNGSIVVSVTKKSKDTLFQKIIHLVQSAKEEKPPSQLFIERFEKTYVKVVLIVVVLAMFVPYYLLGWSWTEAFYRAMVLLVVASPCALVASIMPATLSAISTGARNGILFKGGVHLEALNGIQAIALDKTGTLTKGCPEVTDLVIQDGLSEQEFLAIVASIEKHSTHPLAESIVSYAERKGVTTISPDGIEGIAGWGIAATLNGVTYKIGKKDFVEDAHAFFPKVAEKLAEAGKTLVYVADHNGVFGIIALQDTVRSVAKEAVKKFRRLGIHPIMVTGDHRQTARGIAEETNIDEYIADCLPQEKVEVIKTLKSKYGNVAMVGDGINDAPALAMANVGIAMGTGTDVAIETAGIVLMKNDLSKIIKAIELSKKTNRIIRQNTVFSIAVIVFLILSNFFQILSLPWGVIGHEVSTILVIMNGLRLLKQ